MPREAAWKPQDSFLGGPDWARTHRAAAIAEATGCSLKAAVALVAAAPLRRSDWYGSSAEFEEWIRDERPWLRAPEGDVVPLAGALGWTPEHEDPASAFCPGCEGPLRAVDVPPGCEGPLREGITSRPRPAARAIDPAEAPLALPRPCTKCGGEVAPGSRIYCVKCRASGYDRSLSRQLEIAGLPPAHRTPARNRDGAIPLPAPAARGAVARPTRRERRAAQFAGAPA